MWIGCGNRKVDERKRIEGRAGYAYVFWYYLSWLT